MVALLSSITHITELDDFIDDVDAPPEDEANELDDRIGTLKDPFRFSFESKLSADELSWISLLDIMQP